MKQNKKIYLCHISNYICIWKIENHNAPTLNTFLYEERKFYQILISGFIFTLSKNKNDFFGLALYIHMYRLVDKIYFY